MHHMAEKREAERDILPGFHRKKSEFEFKLLYYNQNRKALSSSFFQSSGPDNIFSHQAVRCHDDHIHSIGMDSAEVEPYNPRMPYSVSAGPCVSSA